MNDLQKLQTITNTCGSLYLNLLQAKLPDLKISKRRDVPYAIDDIHQIGNYIIVPSLEKIDWYSLIKIKKLNRAIQDLVEHTLKAIENSGQQSEIIYLTMPDSPPFLTAFSRDTDNHVYLRALYGKKFGSPNSFRLHFDVAFLIREIREENNANKN